MLVRCPARAPLSAISSPHTRIEPLSPPKSDHQSVVSSAALIHGRTEMQNVRVVLLMMLGAKTAEAQSCVDNDRLVAAAVPGAGCAYVMRAYIYSGTYTCDTATLNTGVTAKEACCASCAQWNALAPSPPAASPPAASPAPATRIRVQGAGHSEYNGVYTTMPPDPNNCKTNAPDPTLCHLESDKPIYVLKRPPCRYPCTACTRGGTGCIWDQPEFRIFVSNVHTTGSIGNEEPELTWCIGYDRVKLPGLDTYYYSTTCAYDVDTSETSGLPPHNGWEERKYGGAYIQGGAPAPTVKCETGCDSFPSSSSDTSDEEGNTMAIIVGVIAGGIVLTAASIIFCTIACSLKCYGIVVLVLACLTLVVNLVSIFTLFGIPAAAVTIVASLLAIPGSSIIACGCCKRPDGQPPIAAGILCLLSFLLRLVALALSLVLSMASLLIPGLGLLFAAVGVLCIVLIVASGLSELILCIKCLCSQCCASITTTAQQGGQAPTGEIEVVVSPAGAQMVAEAGVEIAMVQAAEAGTSHAPLYTTVHRSVFHKRAAEEADAAVVLAEEARKAAEAKTEADAQQVEVTVSEPINPIPATCTDKKEGAQSLAALLASCGLEHCVKVFEDEGYTLEHLISAVQQGQEVAKTDLRELKLTLGACRKLITKLEASM